MPHEKRSGRKRGEQFLAHSVKPWIALPHPTQERPVEQDRIVELSQQAVGPASVVIPNSICSSNQNDSVLQLPTPLAQYRLSKLNYPAFGLTDKILEHLACQSNQAHFDINIMTSMAAVAALVEWLAHLCLPQRQPGLDSQSCISCIFHMWETWRSWPSTGGFSQGTPVPKLPCIPSPLHVCVLFKVWGGGHLLAHLKNLVIQWSPVAEMQEELGSKGLKIGRKWGTQLFLFTEMRALTVELSREIWAAVNNEVLRANENEMRMHERGKQDIPEKTCLLVASYSTIPTCQNPGVTWPGIDAGSPRWETSSLTVQPPWPYGRLQACRLLETGYEYQLIKIGATLAYWVDYSSPVKANRVQFPTGVAPQIFACGNRAGRCYWLVGSPGDIPPPLFPFSFQRHSIPRFAPSSALKTLTIRAVQITPQDHSLLHSQTAVLVAPLKTTSGSDVYDQWLTDSSTIIKTPCYHLLAESHITVLCIQYMTATETFCSRRYTQHFRNTARQSSALRIGVMGHRNGVLQVGAALVEVPRGREDDAAILAPAAVGAEAELCGGCSAVQLGQHIAAAAPGARRQQVAVEGHVDACQEYAGLLHQHQPAEDMTSTHPPPPSRGRDGSVACALPSHLGEREFHSWGISPGFPHVGIVPGSATDRRVFSGISHFPRPRIPTLLRTHLASPSSVLKTSM
ncbi:hypothetical protein PR048_004217 [Dryococelus australis]|uniref:Uncharacterized protein n=1 Tax=Dryococelus australis TaxID=614101 RepID=A0ABQ9I4V5_9NEOP|nr:hypothetical protein PR048_004217 [Dryococelus australis]